MGIHGPQAGGRWRALSFAQHDFLLILYILPKHLQFDCSGVSNKSIQGFREFITNPQGTCVGMRKTGAESACFQLLWHRRALPPGVSSTLRTSVLLSSLQGHFSRFFFFFFAFWCFFGWFPVYNSPKQSAEMS